MVSKFGVIEQMEIYYHPKTQKHLGLARLVFEKVKLAKECVNHLHGRSVMGKQLNCYLDPFGASCKKMFVNLTTEQPKVETPKPPPTLPNDNANGKDDMKSSPMNNATTIDSSAAQQSLVDNNDIDSSGAVNRTGNTGSPNGDGRYTNIRNEKSYREREYKDSGSRRESRDRDRQYDYGRNSSRDSDYNSGSRSRRRVSDYSDRRGGGDSTWGSRDRYRGDERRDSWRHDSRDRDRDHRERGSNNERDYWDHPSRYQSVLLLFSYSIFFNSPKKYVAKYEKMK